ncbi:HTH-type transcriptional regulator LeuO [compost metagenome]
MVNVDIKHLMIFVEMVRLHNGSLVAQKLQMTSPAITQAVQRLRKIFGEPLFIRLPHGLKPTPRALELEPQLRAMLQQWSAIEKGNAVGQRIQDTHYRVGTALPGRKSVAVPIGAMP